MSKRKHEERDDFDENYVQKETNVTPFVVKISEKEDKGFEWSYSYEDLEKNREKKGSDVITTQLKLLKELLFDVQISGEEAPCGEATELPAYVDLFIKDFGLLPLPLNEIVAERLINIIVQSSETRIATKDMDASFEIDPSLVEIRNQLWDEGLMKLVKRVGKELGFQGEIDAKLHKLLLDKKGVFYKNHIDIEKDPDLAAVLMIQLPSNCEGGELIVHAKDGSKLLYDFGQATSKTACLCHFLAHYIGIEHEIRQLKNGYRLALVYTLRWANSSTSSIYNNTDILNRMTKCLDELNNFSYQIGIMLNLTYSVTGNINVLEGVDKTRYQFLEKANAKLPSEKQLSIYLAKANLVVKYAKEDRENFETKRTYKESVDNIHEGYNETEREVHFERLFDVDGFQYLDQGFKKIKDLTFLKRVVYLYSSSPFVDLYDEKNWGKTRKVEILDFDLTLNYHRSLLLIWPKFDDFNTFLKIGEEYAIDFLYHSVQTDRTIFAEDVETLINRLVDKNNVLNEEYTKKMLLVFMKHINIPLFAMFLNDVRFEYPVVELAKLIITYKWKIIKDHLKNALLPVTIETVSKNCDLVKELLVQSNDTEIAYDCLNFAVVPVLDSVWKFSETELMENLYMHRKDRRSLILFTLANTLFLFKDQDISDITEKYVRLVAQLVTEIDQDVLSELVKRFLNESETLYDIRSHDEIKYEFVKEPDEYCRVEFILKLLEIRYKWLNFRLSMDREFRWSMPGSIIDHMDLDTFIRSEDTKITYYDSFKDIEEASSFARHNRGCNHHYSLMINVSENEQKPCVIIEKTREFYELEQKKLKEYETEFQTIKAILNENIELVT